jgi:uncharacterized protein (DUF1501 family)
MTPRSTTRRQFLGGAAGLGLAATGSALGLPRLEERGAGRSLVVVYLRGGADFLNMIVPRRDDAYELSRPGIAIREDELVPLDRDWGLHPALGALKSLHDEGLFAPVVAVGSPHPTRSHFDAQDFMNHGAPGDRTVHSGWLNRYLVATQPEDAARNEFRGVGMQRLLPTALRGDFPVLAVPDGFDGRRGGGILDRFEKFYGADRRRPEPEEEGEDAPMERGGMGRREEEGLDVVHSGKVTIETLRRFQEIVAAPVETDHGYPRSRFGDGMRRIAQVLRSGEGLEVAGIDVDGWDHHANQGGAEGTQARQLEDLALGLAAFRRHMGEAFASTVVLVMTEFGRTVRENGSGGTDHGHGSGMLVLGGGLREGVQGDWKGLDLNSLYEGRDVPVTTDFRDLFATVLREHLDFRCPKDFFPGHRPRTVKLFR